MGLADRLQDKGFALPDEKPVTQTTEHKKLEISAKENRQVFTPLEDRGSEAIKAEQKKIRDEEKDRLKGVQNTLVRWVQDCLLSKEKKELLHEKGSLKLRVTAQWSANFSKDLQALVAGFGGRIAAAGDTAKAQEALKNSEAKAAERKQMEEEARRKIEEEEKKKKEEAEQPPETSEADHEREASEQLAQDKKESESLDKAEGADTTLEATGPEGPREEGDTAQGDSTRGDDVTQEKSEQPLEESTADKVEDSQNEHRSEEAAKTNGNPNEDVAMEAEDSKQPETVVETNKVSDDKEMDAAMEDVQEPAKVSEHPMEETQAEDLQEQSKGSDHPVEETTEEQKTQGEGAPSEETGKDASDATQKSNEGVAQAGQSPAAATGQPEKPGWEKYVARNENWLVAFDIQALDRFIKANPKVLGPADASLKRFVEDHINAIDVENVTVKMLLKATEAKFGPVSQANRARVKAIAADVIQNNNKVGGGAAKAKKAKAAAGPKKALLSMLKSEDDAKWAVEMLAPLGMRAGTQELAATPPASVVGPVLNGLKFLEPTGQMLKSTGLGIIVNCYRSHASPDIASVAKELISTWKQTCLSKKRKAEDQQPKP